MAQIAQADGLSLIAPLDFGHLPDISRVDFRLPEASENTSALNAEMLRGASKTLGPLAASAVFVGCPAWAHKHWMGKIYPLSAKSSEFLGLYSRQFSAIELNTTHYRIPTPAAVQEWRSRVPEGFRFCPKFPQEISHHRELRECEPLTQMFCESLAALGERLGTAFLQLSPAFHPRQLPVLQKFLVSMPRHFPVAVEFRNPAWFESHALASSVRSVLETFNVGTVITDVAGRRDVLHFTLTSPRLMVRFIGNELDPSDYSRLDEWVNLLRRWFEQGLRELYFFVHQPDDVLAPELISYLISRLNERCGTRLPDWKRMDQGTQLSFL